MKQKKNDRAAKAVAARKKGATAGKLALGAVTALNLGLTLALHVLRRQEIIHAVSDEEKVKLLALAKTDTQPEEAQPEQPENGEKQA